GLPGLRVVPSHLLHARGAALAGGRLSDGRHRLPRVQEGHHRARARRARSHPRAPCPAHGGRRAGCARGGQRACARRRGGDHSGRARRPGAGMCVPLTAKPAGVGGPPDLLPHPIKKNEVQITDIPIATITDQYLAVLEDLPELNLDGAGEYLVMAATLTYIKSRMLLPPDPDEEGEGEEDPRAELVQQLLEYQRYREAAADLGSRRLLDREVFAAHGEPEPGAD